MTTTELYKAAACTALAAIMTPLAAYHSTVAAATIGAAGLSD